MKTGILVIIAFSLLLILATAGCLQNPQVGNETQAITTTTTVSPTMTTVPPVTTTAVTIVPTTITDGGSFIFNAIGDHRVGDKFEINGTTNLAPGDHLLVEVVSTSFGPTNKSESGQFYGMSGTVTVRKGEAEGRNQWSFEVDTTGWLPDLYQVTVSGVEVQVIGSSSFRLLPAM